MQRLPEAKEEHRNQRPGGRRSEQCLQKQRRERGYQRAPSLFLQTFQFPLQYGCPSGGAPSDALQQLANGEQKILRRRVQTNFHGLRKESNKNSRRHGMQARLSGTLAHFLAWREPFIFPQMVSAALLYDNFKLFT